MTMRRFYNEDGTFVDDSLNSTSSHRNTWFYREAYNKLLRASWRYITEEGERYDVEYKDLPSAIKMVVLLTT